jgi:undecaprenyl-diphosphatase
MTLPGTLVEFITHRDHSLMQRVNRWYPPRWVRLWALWATRAGDGWLWYLLGIAALFFGGGPRYEAVGAAGLAAGAGVALFVNLKKAAKRRRPHCFQPHCWTTLLPPDQFSFPSGHTITAFAVSVAMIQFYPELSAALMFCAVSIAASRIVLGMHFLSDVLAGAAIGTALALAAAWLV